MNLQATGDGGQRLQVFLAHAGLASRRAAEKLILSGRVSVNGEPALVLGTKVYPGDEVRFDGKALSPETRLHYLALHKPPLYLCSACDPEGRALAQDLLPENIRERLYTIGRLDYRSSGLLLFTNDGEFTRAVSHPSGGVEKEYLVDATAPIPQEAVDEFERGLTIEGEFYRCKEIERLGQKSLRIVLVEGKNREIRRFFSHFHLHPRRLHRIRIGPVELGTLEEGASRPLTEREMSILRGSPGNTTHRGVML